MPKRPLGDPPEKSRWQPVQRATELLGIFRDYIKTLLEGDSVKFRHLYKYYKGTGRELKLKTSIMEKSVSKSYLELLNN